MSLNDALTASMAKQRAELIYTMDEEHFGKLEGHGVKIVNPTKSDF